MTYSSLLLAATILIVYSTAGMIGTELFPKFSGVLLRSTLRPTALLALTFVLFAAGFHALNDHEAGTASEMAPGAFLIEHPATVVIALIAVLIFVRLSIAHSRVDP